MLKIGSVRWRGKCARHPGFDPAMDAAGDTTANCPRCNDLAAIYELHQRALELMRRFRPAEERRPIEKAAAAIDDRQMGLFI